MYNCSNISEVKRTVVGYKHAFIFFIKEIDFTYVDYSKINDRWERLNSNIS